MAQLATVLELTFSGHAKGYYQSLSRTRETTETLPDGTTNYEFELDLKNWGVGIDFGYAITTFLSWKIIDGAVHFNNVSLTNTVNSPLKLTFIKVSRVY